MRFALGETIAVVAMLILALRAMQGWLCRIAAPTTWDYGPAQLAVYVDMVARGAPLYRDFRIAPFIPLVYGPIVPSLTVKLAPLFGSGPMAALEAGRLLTIISTLTACAMIFVLARRIGASRGAATIATLAFMLSPIVLRWGFEYRVDMPALACELGGMVAFLSGATASAMALFIISFYIKQGTAIGIATVVLFCWTSGQRPRAVTFAAVWLVVIAGGTAMLSRRYPYYLLNTFGAVRTMGLDFAAPVLFAGILIGGSVGLTIFAGLALGRRRMTNPLMLCWLIVASIHDLASCLRWGGNAYYFLPSLAALAIIASTGIDLALERMRAMRPIVQLGAGVALALMLSLGFVLAPRSIAMRLREAVSPAAHCAVIGNPWDRRALDILHSVDGPILTDTAELNLADAQSNLQWIDLMVLTSMEQLGAFNDRPLLNAIGRKQIGAFALDDAGLRRNFRGRALFWPELRHAIEANYAAVQGVGPPYLMIPRDAR